MGFSAPAQNEGIKSCNQNGCRVPLAAARSAQLCQEFRPAAGSASCRPCPRQSRRLALRNSWADMEGQAVCLQQGNWVGVTM